MAGSQKTKWLATGKLVGIVSIGLFIISMILIYFEGYETSNGLSVIIILFSFFLYLLYSSLRTWHTVVKPINLIDIHIDKITRVSQLNEKYMESNDKISNFLRRRVANFTEKTQKRFGYTFTIFEMSESNVTVFLKYPANSRWISNSIEIRGGRLSDETMVFELRQFIDDNIV